MKKNKSYKKTDKVCMSDLFIGNEFCSILCELLDFEYNIELKKKSGEKLTDKEYFFDTYMIKPSTIYRFIRKR